MQILMSEALSIISVMSDTYGQLSLAENSLFDLLFGLVTKMENEANFDNREQSGQNIVF